MFKLLILVLQIVGLSLLGAAPTVFWFTHAPIGFTLPIPFLHPHIGLPDSLATKYAADEAKLAAAASDAVRHAKAATAISQAARVALVRTITQIEYRTQTLTKEVPIYVTAQDDARCIVPLGFVRLHDAAAAGQSAVLPGAAGGSDEAASGVPLSAVSETVIANYGVAFQWRAEALSWRNWYAAQKTAWEAKP